MRVVNIAMLVGEAITRIVPDKFNISAQLIRTHNTRIGSGHFFAMINRIKVLIYGNGRGYRVWNSTRKTTKLIYGSASRWPVLVPGRPIWPSRIGSIVIARVVSSPLVWRCGPQP